MEATVKKISYQGEASVPSIHWLFGLAAGISLIMSVALWFLGSKEQGVFVGLWVPSILSLGTYCQVALQRMSK